MEILICILYMAIVLFSIKIATLCVNIMISNSPVAETVVLGIVLTIMIWCTRNGTPDWFMKVGDILAKF